MKTSRLAARAAALLCTCTFVPGSLRAQDEIPLTDPLLPVGVMTAFPTMVQTGTHPTLTWNIMHPSKVGSGMGGGGNGNGNGGGGGSQDIGIVSPPGTIIPLEDVYVSVQIIGTGTTNCQGNNTTAPPSELRISVAGGPYTQLFYGTQAVVNPSHKLFIKKVLKGQPINLGGRYVIGSSWSPFFTTRSSNLQVVSLVNGDSLPVNTQYQVQSNRASYLKPYLDAGGKVKIGPLSVLVVMELAETNRNSPCFDLQDQVVLVTMSRKHPNNGHGNNLDGVDSSNPGKGSGGPNGAVDLSVDEDGNIYDDEGR
jgi:hypothetical protein